MGPDGRDWTPLVVLFVGPSRYHGRLLLFVVMAVADEWGQLVIGRAPDERQLLRAIRSSPHLRLSPENPEEIDVLCGGEWCPALVWRDHQIRVRAPLYDRSLMHPVWCAAKYVADCLGAQLPAAAIDSGSALQLLELRGLRPCHVVVEGSVPDPSAQDLFRRSVFHWTQCTTFRESQSSSGRCLLIADPHGDSAESCVITEHGPQPVAPAWWAALKRDTVDDPNRCSQLTMDRSGRATCFATEKHLVVRSYPEGTLARRITFKQKGVPLSMTFDSAGALWLARRVPAVADVLECYCEDAVVAQPIPQCAYGNSVFLDPCAHSNSVRLGVSVEMAEIGQTFYWCKCVRGGIQFYANETAFAYVDGAVLLGAGRVCAWRFGHLRLSEADGSGRLSAFRDFYFGESIATVVALGADELVVRLRNGGVFVVDWTGARCFPLVRGCSYSYLVGLSRGRFVLWRACPEGGGQAFEVWVSTSWAACDVQSAMAGLRRTALLLSDWEPQWIRDELEE